MKQYLDLLRHVLDHGIDKTDRTGVGTRSVFGYQMRFDLSEGFPLVTTKKVFTKAIVHELLWFLRGDTNIAYLKENGVKIWDAWADANGDLGPIYSKQWRSWQAWRPFPVDNPKFSHDAEPYTIDQIANVIDMIRKNPDSRRLIVTAWNPAEVEAMALPPCHCFFQFNTRPMTLEQRYAWFSDKQGGLDFSLQDDEDYVKALLDEAKVPIRLLDCQLYQRSADSFLGVPFNIASYALLTSMIAQVTNTVPGDFVHTFGDLHIYSNHIEQVRLQLTREPRPLSVLMLNDKIREINDFRFEDISLYEYDPHPTITGEVAV